MDVNLFLDQYLEEIQRNENQNIEENITTVCRRMYELTGEMRYYNYIVNELTELINKEGTIRNEIAEKYILDSINAGKELDFLFGKTGEKKYREAMDRRIDWIRHLTRTKNGVFSHSKETPDLIWLSDFYKVLPFYMEYETGYNNKAEYNDIIAQFQKVRKYLYNEEVGLYYQAYNEANMQPWCNEGAELSQEFSARSMGWYMMAIVDVIGNMSKEIYEHYRSLGDLFKEAVKGILPYKDAETGLFFQSILGTDKEDKIDLSGSAMIGYAICKACRIGILSKEHYAKEGLTIVEKVCCQEKTDTDVDYMSAIIIAYAQEQMLRKEL